MRLTILLLFIYSLVNSQTKVDVFPDSLLGNLHPTVKPGVFYVPKTTEAQNDFLGNGMEQNTIRLHIIESALNNSTNLTQTLAFLDNVKTVLQTLANKTDRLMFIFEKMPTWLSSSSDGSPASTPGWFVLNTKPPANYNAWNEMVDSVTRKIVVDYGISNAYFEIWNEPDLGSWTGTEQEYFTLFKNTYTAIKNVNSTIATGGPATNFWANHINYQPPYGYLSNSYANLSLIKALLDSSVAWNKPLDFLSWHNFNIAHQQLSEAENFVRSTCSNLSIPVPELIISEWNTPSNVRDTPLQKSYMIKNHLALTNTGINAQVVAAWQDFSYSTNEFHNDYGLLTDGSIHKPAYKALQLVNKLKGITVKTVTNAPTDIYTTLVIDTLQILITNYTAPAFIMAFNHTLFNGKLNAFQLDSIGVINVSTNYFLYLDSIYKGLITIPNSNPIYTAINNSISIYKHYDSIETGSRSFKIDIAGITGNYIGENYTIDSTKNNSQYKYDSLLSNGFTQNMARTFITNNQDLSMDSIMLNSGVCKINLQANAVCLLTFVIPNINSVEALTSSATIYIYPNPAKDKLTILSDYFIERLLLLDLQGKVVASFDMNSYSKKIDVSTIKTGVYLLQDDKKIMKTKKVIIN